MDINITEILTTLGTILSGIGIGWASKSGRMKEKADAYKKMGEAYQYRIDALHEDIETCNKTIKENQGRIAELNHALNAKEDELHDKTMQIRKLTEQGYTSEQEVNRVQNLLNEAKNDVIRLTEERDFERARADYAEMWRCELNDCQDPRGRKPPRNLAGLKYSPPKKARYKIA